MSVVMALVTCISESALILVGHTAMSTLFFWCGFNMVVDCD